MKQYKHNMITKSQRAIAYFLLTFQLLTSCRGKQEMIILNTFLNDQQENCVEKEDCKSIISAIEETKASSITNQVHEKVTRRSSPTFALASQPISQERVDSRLKVKNTSHMHKRIASKSFSMPVWQKAALFGIALNNTFSYASRPYAFNKEPNQNHISTKPKELASTSTDQVQPKTIENDSQIPTNKPRPVFARAKNSKNHSKKEGNSFYDPLMNSSLLENFYHSIDEHIRNERYARQQAIDRAIYLATVAYEKKMLAGNLSDTRKYNTIKTFSPPVWDIMINTLVYISCQLEESLMQRYFLHLQKMGKEGEGLGIFILQCDVSNDSEELVDIELAMAQTVKDASLYYTDMSTSSELYSIKLGEGIDFSTIRQEKDFNATEGIQLYPIEDLQDGGKLKSKLTYKIPPKVKKLPLLHFKDMPSLACLSSFKKEQVHKMLTQKYANCFESNKPPFFEAKKECYPKSKSALSANGDYVFNIIMLYKTAEDSSFRTSDTAYQWATNLRCFSLEGNKRGLLTIASAEEMSTLKYNGGLGHLRDISNKRTMDLINSCYIPPLKEGTGYDLDKHGNCLEIVNAEGKQVHDELIQTKATIELLPT